MTILVLLLILHLGLCPFLVQGDDGRRVAGVVSRSSLHEPPRPLPPSTPSPSPANNLLSPTRTISNDVAFSPSSPSFSSFFVFADPTSPLLDPDEVTAARPLTSSSRLTALPPDDGVSVSVNNNVDITVNGRHVRSSNLPAPAAVTSSSPLPAVDSPLTPTVEGAVGGTAGQVRRLIPLTLVDASNRLIARGFFKPRQVRGGAETGVGSAVVGVGDIGAAVDGLTDEALQPDGLSTIPPRVGASAIGGSSLVPLTFVDSSGRPVAVGLFTPRQAAMRGGESEAIQRGAAVGAIGRAESGAAERMGVEEIGGRAGVGGLVGFGGSAAPTFGMDQTGAFTFGDGEDDGGATVSQQHQQPSRVPLTLVDSSNRPIARGVFKPRQVVVEGGGVGGMVGMREEVGGSMAELGAGAGVGVDQSRRIPITLVDADNRPVARGLFKPREVVRQSEGDGVAGRGSGTSGETRVQVDVGERGLGGVIGLRGRTVGGREVDTGRIAGGVDAVDGGAGSAGLSGGVDIAITDTQGSVVSRGAFFPRRTSGQQAALGVEEVGVGVGVGDEASHMQSELIPLTLVDHNNRPVARGVFKPRQRLGVGMVGEGAAGLGGGDGNGEQADEVERGLGGSAGRDRQRVGGRMNGAGQDGGGGGVDIAITDAQGRVVSRGAYYPAAHGGAADDGAQQVSSGKGHANQAISQQGGRATSASAAPVTAPPVITPSTAPQLRPWELPYASRPPCYGNRFDSAKCRPSRQYRPHASKGPMLIPSGGVFTPAHAATILHSRSTHPHRSILIPQRTATYFPANKLDVTMSVNPSLSNFPPVPPSEDPARRAGRRGFRGVVAPVSPTVAEDEEYDVGREAGGVVKARQALVSVQSTEAAEAEGTQFRTLGMEDEDGGVDWEWRT